MGKFTVRGSKDPFPSARYPGLLVRLAGPGGFYLSGRSGIWHLGYDGVLKKAQPLPLPRFRLELARIGLLRRLGRLDVREMVYGPDGYYLAVVEKQIFKWSEGRNIARRVFQVNDGGHPKGLLATPQGHLFVGEYWGNPNRRPLRVWASMDQGENWETVYTLPAGRAKHLHNLVWDEHRQGIWVLTGDADHESALLFTDDGFRTVSEVARGSQMYRACQVFCRPEGLYYATDTERAENWFLFLDPGAGQLHRLQPLPGSCFYAATMAGRHFLSTSVEPSQVNRHNWAALWSSPDLQAWHKVVEFKKDWWPGEYFGFGSIVLPRVQGETSMVAFSTQALKPYDLTTFIMPLPRQDEALES